MIETNRYLLFAGLDHYPQRFFRDFRGAFETIELAETVGKGLVGTDWWEVVDLDQYYTVSYGRTKEDTE